MKRFQYISKKKWMAIVILVLCAVGIFLAFADISLYFRRLSSDEMPVVLQNDLVGKTDYDICKILGKPDAVESPTVLGTFAFGSHPPDKVYIYDSLNAYILFAKGRVLLVRDKKGKVSFGVP